MQDSELARLSTDGAQEAVSCKLISLVATLKIITKISG